MNAEATQILWGIYTISVLGLGYWTGHRRGKEVLRPSVVALEQQISQHKDAEARYQSAIEMCQASGRQVAEQGRVLSTVAASQELPVPAPLMSAIDKLVQATQSLSEQLAAAQKTASGELNVAKPAENGSATQPRPAPKSKPKQPTRQSIQPPLAAVPLDFRPPSMERRTPVQRQANLTEAEITQFAHDSSDREPEHWHDTPTRYEYNCEQLMAPWTPGDSMPAPRDFRTVTCHDISVRGISFIVEERPQFDSVVISVGPRSSPVYMLSEVEDYKAVYMHDQVGYLVSCRFVRRIEQRPEFSAAAVAET